MNLSRLGFPSKKQRGFTIMELIIVIVVIGILAAVVIVTLSPGKSLGDSRNSKRSADISEILNAVYQYALDNNGTLPASITTTATEICKTGGTCTGLTDLTVLTTSEKYLVSLPRDPKCGSVASCTTNGTGYQISKSANNRITVSAPAAEQGKTISVTK